MLVHELIKELQELPQFLELLIDVTPRGSRYFQFKELNTVGEFEGEGDKYVALACGQEYEEPDNSN